MPCASPNTRRSNHHRNSEKTSNPNYSSHVVVFSPQKVSLKERLGNKANSLMGSKLAARAGYLKRTGDPAYANKRRDAILFLEQHAAYLSEKLHARQDFTRCNPHANTRSPVEADEMSKPYLGSLEYLARWEPGEDWPIQYDDRDWTVLPPNLDSPASKSG